MHNISKQHIKDLADQLAQASINETTEEVLTRARELYEKAIVLHYTATLKVASNIIKEDTAQEQTHLSQEKESVEPKEIELSVQEKIQQIMDTAPKFTPKSSIVSEDKPPIVQTESPSNIETTKPDDAFELEKKMPKVSLEDEFKDAVSADYAADLFERAEKIEITKKSLNDKLSQTQLQIGLNDRIAFVKHLFNGSQSDFNRVLSQLNSFQSELQAKQFIETIVKPDYNWESEIEYEERFMVLIERKFL